MEGHQFIYEYVFESDGGDVVAHVSYAFENISELETISCFPHQERREFALSLMAKYEADKYHVIDPIDVACPFAVQLQKLFEGSLKVYWTRKFRATLLFFTGYSKLFRIPCMRSFYHCELTWIF